MTIIIKNEVAALIVESANGFATSFSLEVAATDSLAAAMGTSPTFEEWEANGNAWKVQYKLKRQCEQAAADMAWSRAVGRLKEQCGLVKPKAATQGAQDKAEKRSEAAKAVEAEINSCAADPVKLAEKATKALAKGDAAGAALATKALTKVQKENAATAAKASKEAATKKREAIREALKNADDKMLDTVLGILAGELVATKKRTK